MCIMHQYLEYVEEQKKYPMTDEEAAQQYSWLVYAGWQKETSNIHEMRTAVARAHREKRRFSTVIPNLNDTRFEATIEAYRTEQEMKRHFPLLNSSDKTMKAIRNEADLEKCKANTTRVEV